MAIWHDIYHCAAIQLQIRAIHAQPHPIGRIPCKTWELGQTVAQDACTDVGNLFRPFETSVNNNNNNNHYATTKGLVRLGRE